MYYTDSICKVGNTVELWYNGKRRCMVIESVKRGVTNTFAIEHVTHITGRDMSSDGEYRTFRMAIAENCILLASK